MRYKDTEMKFDNDPLNQFLRIENSLLRLRFPLNHSYLIIPNKNNPDN